MIRSRQFKVKFGAFCLIVFLIYTHLVGDHEQDTSSPLFPTSRQRKITKDFNYSTSSMKNQVTKFDCSNENQLSKDDHSLVNAKEFFIFEKSGLVWCNVFKSASTSVLYIMGLLEGFSYKELQKMSRHPLVSEMRKIYGRPSTEALLEAVNSPNVKTFLVKRHPFERLFSGYKDKILRAIRGSHHDKLSREILHTYRNLPRRLYRFKKTVPTFAEFTAYVLDTFDAKGEIDMHWAPVVDFCSVCKVNFTRVVDFRTLAEDMQKMLPKENSRIFEKRRLQSIKLNVNKKSPLTNQYMVENLASLGPTLYQRLCALYSKDFEVFGYSYPTFKDLLTNSDQQSKIVPFTIT